MKYLVYIFILGTSIASAKQKVSEFQLTVNYGEKVNTFELRGKDELVVNGTARKVSEKNVEHLQTLATAALKEKTNDQKLCTRSYMRLETPAIKEKKLKTSEVVGCINSKTPAAKKLAELANTLVIL